MKVAVILTGCSYGMRKDTRLLQTDWNQAKYSIKRNVIDCFIEQGHEVSVYLTTYVTDQVPAELINFYKPKKTVLLQFEGSQQRTTYLESMRQLLNEDVDLIVSTRFDIAFSNPITQFNINYNKFNFQSKLKNLRYWVDHQFVDDNIFIFPKKYLQNFIDTVQYIMAEWHFDVGFHPSYNYMVKFIGQENVNFLVEGLHCVGDNYELKRVCYCPLAKENCDCWLDSFKRTWAERNEEVSV